MRSALLLAITSSVLGATPATGQACRQAKTALVLSGGGAKGLAHIGVLEVLDSLGVRPDLVVGTSMGAIVGALYASGYSARQIDSIAQSLPIAETVRPFRTPTPHPWDDRLPLVYLVRGARGVSLATGIVDETQPNARLNAALLRGNLRAAGRFDRLPIPFLAVATDLRNKQTVVLGHGDLARAVRASSAIPLVFPPVPWDGAVLVDGGLSANIPVGEARTAGAERVIVVDVTEHPRDSLNADSPLALADQLFGFLFQQATPALNAGDVWIRPDVQDYRSLDFSPESIAEIRRRGRVAADTSAGRFGCLSAREPWAQAPEAVRVAGWTVPGPAAESTLVGKLLGIAPGVVIAAGELRERLVDVALAEGFRGLWLNPDVSNSGVTFRAAPIPAPSLVGGAGLAYDHELGGVAWAGVFGRRVLATPLEASLLGSVGRFAREVFLSGSWHVEAASTRWTPTVTLRGRVDDIRQFAEDGTALATLPTQQVRGSAGIELRLGRWVRIRATGDLFAYGGEGSRGAGAVGGAVRVSRSGRGPTATVEAVATDRFRWATGQAQWRTTSRGWSLSQGLHLGFGSRLPVQWAMPLGGDEGFPGLHLGELRSDREFLAALQVGRRLLGPVELRIQPALGLATRGAAAGREWLGGVRLGIGADTPAGPLDIGYGLASNGRRAFYLRAGQWF